MKKKRWKKWLKKRCMIMNNTYLILISAFFSLSSITAMELKPNLTLVYETKIKKNIPGASYVCTENAGLLDWGVCHLYYSSNDKLSHIVPCKNKNTCYGEKVYLDPQAKPRIDKIVIDEESNKPICFNKNNQLIPPDKQLRWTYNNSLLPMFVNKIIDYTSIITDPLRLQQLLTSEIKKPLAIQDYDLSTANVNQLESLFDVYDLSHLSKIELLEKGMKFYWVNPALVTKEISFDKKQLLALIKQYKEQKEKQ